jgi:hypothetical protein
MAGCASQDCEGVALAHGLCRKHYWQQRRDLLRQQKCSVSVCGKPQFCAGYCRGHYARARKGKVLETPLNARKAGNATVTVRISTEALALLERHAKAGNTTASRLAAMLILRELGLAP